MTTSDTPHISWTFPADARAPGLMKCVHCGTTQQTGPGWDDFVRRHARCGPSLMAILPTVQEYADALRKLAAGNGYVEMKKAKGTERNGE